MSSKMGTPKSCTVSSICVSCFAEKTVYSIGVHVVSKLCTLCPSPSLPWLSFSFENTVEGTIPNLCPTAIASI